MIGILMILVFCILCLPTMGETIVTSFYPIRIFAMNLTAGIQELQVHNLADNSTGCLHDYQLQTGDMKKLAEADVFLVNGAGMENFLDLVTEAFPKLPVVTASDGIRFLEDEDEHDHEDEHEDEHEHVNAHVWLDVGNAMIMVQNLKNGLCEVFPAYADRIEANADAYTVRLTALDQEIRDSLTLITHHDIITFHEAFPYFAKAYGLNVAAVVNQEPGETLSPTKLGELIDLVQSLGCPPLFTEPQYEDLSAKIVSQETGASVYILDPVVTGPEDDVLTYFEECMRENVGVLLEALH